LIPDISPQLVSAGNPNIYVPVCDKSIVDRASTGPAEMRTLRGDTAEMLCLYVFTPTPNGAYSRMFAPELGVFEDPATGSAAGPLAAYMMRYGLALRRLTERGC
jgi:trans-2,3-dihydro-3-hydroxyanthranilate isomerase